MDHINAIETLTNNLIVPGAWVPTPDHPYSFQMIQISLHYTYTYAACGIILDQPGDQIWNLDQSDRRPN